MTDLRTRLGRYGPLFGAGAVVALIGIGFLALARLTREIHIADVRSAMGALSPGQIALALTFTIGSYVALVFYDVMALRVIGRPLPWRTAALASFTSYTLSHNLGLSLLTGGSARYRIYTAAGLDGPDVARVVGIAGATFWTGVVAVTGAALVTHHGPVMLGAATIGEGIAQLIGGGILIAIAGVVVLCGLARQPISLFGFAVPLPRPGQAIAQIGVAVIDIGLAGSALFVLIPHAPASVLPAFVLAYALAIVAAVVTHVPGGLGVFEAVILAIVPADRATVFAALIAYRVIYYLLPLGVGIALLAWHEGARLRHSLRWLVGARAVASSVAPLALSAATFLGGAMLLLSGSLPALKERMGGLTAVLPLPFIEASHVAASLVGTALLLLAPGLLRRLDGAFVATRALLLAGAFFSIAKGIDYEEAIVCLAVAALLQWTRRAFYRRTALTTQPLSLGWLASVASMVGLAAWAGFFAYRRIPYSGDLWWQFAADADAPRFLRASLATAVLLASTAVWRLLSPAQVVSHALDSVHLDRAGTILAQAVRTDALLALTGDKRFLLSDAGDAFVMYQVEGASWIVMGDPVGPRDAWAELLWGLRDMADRAQGRLLLYEVSTATLDLAIGMGLNIIKFGEDAVVDLSDFTLDTPRLRAVRRSERAVARKGAQFRVIPADAVPIVIDELAAVSDEWMAVKGGAEKGFSLGFFDRAYIAKFDIAVVYIDDRIVAFANLWLTATRTEASIDLMRHRADAPQGTMDFLLANLMLWSGARGYAQFSLGMAPLSGIEDRRLAPAWAKMAAFIFRHGERFYGFRGLRAYKEKFDPIWEPRYIAGPQGIALIQALRDLSRLIGRAGKPAPVRSIPRPVLGTYRARPAPAPTFEPIRLATDAA